MTVAELTARISVIGEAAAVRSLKNVGKAARGVGEAIRTAADATRLFEVAQQSLATVSGVQAAMAYDSQVRGLAAYSRNAQELQAQLGRLTEIAKLPGLGLKEVRNGVLQLEAAGLSAETSERALMAFGNALALVGRGKGELDGVILALGQIASKGQISAEEINQIAERVPQVRQALMQAFGTASTEAIQKMGISAQDAIGRIISAMEQLPKATGGAIVTFENLQDAIEAAFLPVGRGILDIFSASSNGATRLIDLIGEVGRQIGEVFSAVGNSGVIQNAFETFFRVLNLQQGIGNFQDLMIVAISNILAYMSYIPMFWQALIHDIGAGFVFVKDSIIYYFGEAYTWAAGKWNEFMSYMQTDIKDFGTAFAEFFQPIIDGLKIAVQILTLGMVNLPGTKPFGDIGILAAPNVGKIPIPTQDLQPPKFAPESPMFALPHVNDLAKSVAEEYRRAISGMLGPQGLPGGMIFGGGVGAGGADSPTRSLLGQIADNTRTTADALTLRRETLGGGKLGALGITGAELSGINGPRDISFGDFTSRGNRGLIPAGTELERSIRRIYRDEARKNGQPGIMRRA